MAIVVAVLWLVRQPIAEAIARGVCSEQKLVCKFSITRLDFGGVSLTNLDARAPNAPNAAISARELAVELAWDNPFAPRPVAVGGDALVVRLDLTGKRPLLGDLDTAITYFTKPTGKPPAPTPRLDIKSLKVIGDTLSGPVEANGTIVAQGPDAFVIDLTATPARLGLSGATVQLAGGQLKATIAGDRISGAAKLDLARFEAENTAISDVKIDATLEQAAGVLKGSGSATLGAVALKDTTITGAQAKASLESPAVDPKQLDINLWVASLRRLQLAASTGEGAIGDNAWKKAELKAQIDPKPTGGSAGDISFSADDVRVASGAAGRVELTGKIDVAVGLKTTITGDGLVRGGAWSSAGRKTLAEAVSAPLESALPSFGDAASRAIDRAGQAFTVSAPWSAVISTDGLVMSLRDGAKLEASSGLSAILSAATGEQTVASLSTNGGASWKAAGALRLSGGGAPTLVANIGQAAGLGDKASITGAVSLKSWKVVNDTISAEVTGLEFNTDKGAGKAAAQLTVRLDGALGGGVWKGARGTGEVNAVWDRETFAADAPRGVVIEWDQAAYGKTKFGAAALHYAPTGRLAERVGDGLIGRGVLASVKIPVTGDGFDAGLTLGAVGINWRAAGGFRANFNTAPSSLALKFGERSVPARIEDITGELDLRDGWNVAGDFKGGHAEAAEATVADLAGKFDLSGKGEDLSGSITGLSMRVFDPLPEAERRYEEAAFEGAATLKNSVADFSGLVTMKKSGVQIANIKGRHALSDGSGSLTFEPTPLIFVPKKFEPSDLSPTLRGPADVLGRVDISGGASWSKDGVKARALADLRKLDFTLASAGVFEGVAGKIEIADLINMKTDKPQTINIEKVTLGLPIEKGSINFMLIGFDAIRLVEAQWPFAGGSIRVRPTEFSFAAGAENRIVAQAVNWDLAKIVEQFKVPDIKLQGLVGGDFPVVFSTGSATIDHAVLEATKDGGVIQYSGSTGDAAAQADQNSKMVFDALKDFHYEVLKVGLNGDLAGRLTMSVSVLGRNPAVMGGQPFQLNIGIDSALMQLLSSVSQNPSIRAAVEQVTGDNK